MNEIAVDPTVAADIENKRRLVFASLMLYAPETGALRERAMEHAVLAALVGSSPSVRMKNGEIQKHLSLGTCGTILRPEVISKILDQLWKKGLVDGAEVEGGKTGYFLTIHGEEQANRDAGLVGTLLTPVLNEMLEHSAHLLPRETAERVCTDFICSAFARLGSSIASYVGGQQSQVGNGYQLRAIAEEVADRHGLKAEGKSSIVSRCVALLKSKTPAAKKLIFHLTQGYYFAQLLGIDKNTFNPIAEQAFADAIFYCDTNVLFVGLLPGDRGVSFSEIANLAKRCGIQLRVTRATIEEARHVAAGKLVDLRKIDGPIPNAIAELSSDEFVTHFFQLKRERPDLTPEEFMQDFFNLPEVAEARWGILLEEINEDEMLLGIETTGQEATLQQAVIAARGYGKSSHVLRHDIAHYIFILKCRKDAPKAWFLTRDQSLIIGAPALANLEKPKGESFCFSMLGFLQSISPFIQTSDEDDVIARFFSSLVSDQIFLSEKLFDGKELALMAEMHSDVMATPAEVLVPAVDYIKHSVLHGRAYSREDTQKVSLELKKFLASSSEEKRAALQERTIELEALNNEARNRLRAEQNDKDVIEAQLRETMEALETANLEASERQRRIDVLEKIEQRRAANRKKIRELSPAVLCFGAAIAAAHFSSKLEGEWGNHVKGTLSESALRWLVNLSETTFLILPTLMFTGRSSLSSSRKYFLYTLTIGAWIFILGLHLSPKFGPIADFAGVVAFFASLPVMFEKQEG